MKVDGFIKVSKTPANAPSLYESLSTLKQRTKNTQVINFLAALLESLAAFNDFSSLDASIKKEMLQGCQESVQFYLNRILKEAKEHNEQPKIEWVKEFNTVFKTLLEEGNNSNTSKNINNQSDNNQSKQSTKLSTPSATTGSTKLSGNVWYCEGYTSTANECIEIKIEEMQQRLVISKCSGCVIKISGKCTAISIEQASKIGVLIEDSIVSTVEVLNSNKVQVQLSKVCPIMTVDNCEGVQVFLAAGFEKQFELLTCKSNEINLYRQEAGKEGEYEAEIAVPEQFKSYFDAQGVLKTEPVKHTGA